MNPCHHGTDEQMFGAAQQVLHRGLARRAYSDGDRGQHDAGSEVDLTR